MRYINLARHEGVLVIHRSEVDEDGNTFVHQIRMPPETLSIRAGEYGLDPVKDYDAVLDIILHEMYNEDSVSPLVTAATLEEARDTVLERCRGHRDRLHKAKPKKRPSREEDEAHVDVLDALSKTLVVDQQLALLFRMSTKATFKHRKEVMNQPKISLKAQIIDGIRSEMEESERERERRKSLTDPGKPPS